MPAPAFLLHIGVGVSNIHVRCLYLTSAIPIRFFYRLKPNRFSSYIAAFFACRASLVKHINSIDIKHECIFLICR